jgi:hypothetical protein
VQELSGCRWKLKRMVPELAITSVPSVKSLKKFIPEEELWPPGPSWGQGKQISANEYVLLIGDQEAAREKMRELGSLLSESSNEFTYGNYYRFFPDMIKRNDGDRQGETQIPRAAGFGEGR